MYVITICLTKRTVCPLQPLDYRHRLHRRGCSSAAGEHLQQHVGRWQAGHRVRLFADLSSGVSAAFVIAGHAGVSAQLTLLPQHVRRLHQH